MRIARRRFLRRISAAAVCLAVPVNALAQSIPTRPITFIVPYAAGGPTDLIARVLADRMRTSLGQTIIVENITGAAGSIGVGRVARATPDGYTLSLGNNGSNVLTGALDPPPFDLVRDFEPVARLVSNSQVVISRKSLAAGTLAELISWLKQNKASIGIAGPVATVSAAEFESITATHYQFVPYRGAAPAIQDLMAGNIDMMIDQLSNASAQIKAGTVRAYAVTAKSRAPAAPDVPTVDEAGLPGFYTSLWSGLWAPKATPRAVIARLSEAAQQALADPMVKQRLAEVGQDVVPVSEQSPDALAAYQKAEVEKWLPIARAANLKSE